MLYNILNDWQPSQDNRLGNFEDVWRNTCIQHLTDNHDTDLFVYEIVYHYLFNNCSRYNRYCSEES